MRFALILALSLTYVQDAKAWGQEGHSIIAEIAHRRILPQTRAAVAAILGDGVSLASVSNWADGVRPQRPKTYKWHFVDIPLAISNYDPNRDCQDSNEGDCAINAIERNKATLKDSNADPNDRREALRFLVHFVGDLHQPLHTVKEQRGGNDLHVSFFVDPLKMRKEKTNLHTVWDSGLIRASFWNWGAYVDYLMDTWLLANNAQALLAGNAIDWALDAHKAAREVAFTVSENDDLGQAYLSAARPIVDRQLAAGGVRLAALLDELLGQ